MKHQRAENANERAFAPSSGSKATNKPFLVFKSHGAFAVGAGGVGAESGPPPRITCLATTLFVRCALLFCLAIKTDQSGNNLTLTSRLTHRIINPR
jgi:hypothetical protein